MDEIESRFQELKFHFRVDSIRKIAEILGIHNQRLLDIKSGKAKRLAKDIIKSLSTAGINPIWLETGEGEMLLNSEKAKDDIDYGEVKVKPHITDKQRGVPFYSMDVTGSLVRSFSDIPEDPEFFVDYPPFNDCKAYFQVYGDSMYPRFASGEVIAVKQMNNLEIIWWGEPYLVITNELADNMRTVKMIHKHDEDDKIILRASNPNFGGDIVIPREAIEALYLVKGKITRYQL